MVNLKIKKKKNTCDSQCLIFLVYELFYVLGKANTVVIKFQLVDDFLKFYC